MEVKFFNFGKRTNSTKRPDLNNPLFTAQCQIKEPCSIMSPTLIMSTGYISATYAYISNWDRYYFITDINIVTGGRIEISLKNDTLATCKNAIADYSCFVERSSSQYDDMFNDPIVSNTEQVEYRAYAETDIGTGFTPTGCYIIRTINGASNGISTYVTNKAGVKSFMHSLFDTTKYGFLADEVVKSFFNPFQYVVSVMWVPIYMASIVNSDKTENICCGWWDTGEIAYTLDKEGVTVGGLINIPNNRYSDFRRYSNRFSNYNLFLPGVGTIGINATDTATQFGYMLYIDAKTGFGQYVLTSSNGEIASFKTQFGVPVQIGQLNSNMLNIANSVPSAAASALSGNVVGAVSSLVDSAHSAFNPTASINGMNGDKYTFTNNSKIILSVICRGTGERATATAGRPLYATKRLGNLSGFIKCGNASIDTGYYSTEKDEVNNYLNSGFYME